jgi:protein-S-isoprenylcysteine O-methyltransferase Ste14
VRFGGWLFRHRTSIPLPIVLALLFVPAQRLARPLFFDVAGAILVALGELTRLWAVRHIGAISRTRSDRLGPLVSTGPFAIVRNPLYIGNIALWVGFSLAAHLPLLAPVVAVVLAVEYHAIVRWEEALLESRRGEEYRAYAARVPRWIPRTQSQSGQKPQRLDVAGDPTFSWRETLYSERGTLIAIAAGYGGIWIKVKS